MYDLKVFSQYNQFTEIIKCESQEEYKHIFFMYYCIDLS